jgi:hypothetical protein
LVGQIFGQTRGQIGQHKTGGDCIDGDITIRDFTGKGFGETNQPGFAGAVIGLSGLPRDAARLLKEARRGRLKIDLDLKRLDHFGYQLDRSTNRLTIGILTAALIIGSSIVMTVQGGPTLFGLPLFGLLGFMIAFFNSIWIVLSIWRAKE